MSRVEPKHRRLHVVDIENLLLGRHADASESDIEGALLRGCRQNQYRSGDHLVVACNPAIGLRVGRCMSGGQLLVRRGKDGADQALLDWCDPIHLARRYESVAIWSRDRAFEPLRDHLRALGVHAWTTAPSIELPGASALRAA